MERTLQNKDRKQLNGWLGGMKAFELLYKASRDGCSATAFHQKCNTKGPTVTVFYNTSDCVFGGYTAVDWDSSGTSKTDHNAFLFKLHYKSAWKPKKYPTVNGSNAINCTGTYGPTFGGGPDLYSFNGTVTNNGTSFPLNGAFSMGSSYQMGGDNSATFACNFLNCFDIEVYSVVGMNDNPLSKDNTMTLRFHY